MVEVDFKYIDRYNNDIVVTLEYVSYSDMKYTVIYCSACNTTYQYIGYNYLEVRRICRMLLHDILTFGFLPNMEELGFTIYSEIPF